MPKDYHDTVKNLEVGDILKVDRRYGYPAVVKLFEQFGYKYEDIIKPTATWARNIRRVA